MSTENEHIDVSQWLPKSFAEAYPNAYAKSEMVATEMGKNLKSIFRGPIDILFECDSISSNQFYAARLIIKTRQAISNNLKTDQILQEYLGHEFDVDTNGMGPGTLLALMLANLKPYQTQIIDRVCLQRQRQDYGYQERILTENDRLWIAKCIGTLRESLDQVKINIDAVLKSVKK